MKTAPISFCLWQACAKTWRTIGATDLPDRTGGPARYVRVEETVAAWASSRRSVTILRGLFKGSSHPYRPALSLPGHETSADLRQTLRGDGAVFWTQRSMRRLRFRPEGPRFSGGSIAHARDGPAYVGDWRMTRLLFSACAMWQGAANAS